MEMCSESGYGVVDGVGGRTEYLRDGIHPESESEKVIEKGVPLQHHGHRSLPPDILTNLKKDSHKLEERVSEEVWWRKVEM